jgi:hypothetical protein
VLQAENLLDRLVEVPLINLICRHGGGHRGRGSFWPIALFP